MHCGYASKSIRAPKLAQVSRANIIPAPNSFPFLHVILKVTTSSNLLAISTYIGHFVLL